MQIINGRKLKEESLVKLKEEVEKLSFSPIFCDILVGDDPASVQYVRMKAKLAESIGIKFRTAEFPESITTEELVNEIENLNKVPHMCGIIVQLPLPPSSNLNKDEILDAIDPVLDVDCLGSYNNNNFYNDMGSLGYPTALACMKLLDSVGLDLNSKNIVVLGQGKLVGRPVAHLLKKRNLNVVVVNNKTENPKDIIKEADIIISAIGQGKFITGDMVKSGVIVIDAGTSEENGSVVGDVDFDSVKDIASFITPTPGGVGPVTVATLLENIVNVAKNKTNVK